MDLPSWTWPWKRKWKSLSLWPQGLYSPWNSPGHNTGVGSLSLLQGIFPTQGTNPGLLYCRPILYQLSYQNLTIFKIFLRRDGWWYEQIWFFSFFGGENTVYWILFIEYCLSPSGSSVSISGSGFSKRPMQDVRSWCKRESVFNSKMALWLSGQQKWGHQWVFRFHVAPNL